ncbi:MAG: hypothetical protein ACK41O_27175, partial [Runella zeae]
FVICTKKNTPLIFRLHTMNAHRSFPLPSSSSSSSALMDTSVDEEQNFRHDLLCDHGLGRDSSLLLFDERNAHHPAMRDFKPSVCSVSVCVCVCVCVCSMTDNDVFDA